MDIGSNLSVSTQLVGRVGPPTKEVLEKVRTIWQQAMQNCAITVREGVKLYTISVKYSGDGLEAAVTVGPGVYPEALRFVPNAP